MNLFNTVELESSEKLEPEPIYDKILILIDLQTYFEASSYERLLKTVEHEIDKAINENIPIIVINYDMHDNLQSRIKNKLKKCDPKLLYKLIKDQDDGSSKIVPVLNELNFNSGNIYVTGVNTGACVFETVCSLQKYSNNNYNVIIIENGCWAGSPDCHFESVGNMIKYHRIKVVYTARSKPYNYKPLLAIRKTSRDRYSTRK